MADEGACSTGHGTEKKIATLPAKRVKVTVCSSFGQCSVQGFIDYLNGLTAVVEGATFMKLPYNVSDLNKVDLKGVDVLLLCHSVTNRRFSITNVTDALYDEFLPKTRQLLGQSKVGVIVHDVPGEEPEKMEQRMDSFRSTQRTTFENTSVVLILGRLDVSPVTLTSEQDSQLLTFFGAAASLSIPEKVFAVITKIVQCLGDMFSCYNYPQD